MNVIKKIKRILETKGQWLAFIGMIIWSIYLIAQYVHADLKVILDKLVVDDAFYYFGIAKHVVTGKGFTFDGLNRTNGFQPLWQLLILPIFAIFKDPLLQIKVVIFLGGLLHALSGFLLFFVFNRIWSKGWSFVNHLFLGIKS